MGRPVPNTPHFPVIRTELSTWDWNNVCNKSVNNCTFCVKSDFIHNVHSLA